MNPPMTVSPDLSQARVGVIGGSGLYGMPGLDDVDEMIVETPFGCPSDALKLGRLKEMDVVFLARHGKHHHLLPREVPYQANLWAMRKLGVRWLISVSAVGSLRDHLRPRDMVVPDQFIDRTQQRPQSFFGNGCVAHVSLADPTCTVLSELLADAAEAAIPQGQLLHRGGDLPVHGGAGVLHTGGKHAVSRLGMFSDRHDQSHRSPSGTRGRDGLRLAQHGDGLRLLAPRTR